MASCNNDELANHVLAPEEEYARAGNAYWWNIATNKPFSGLALENWTDFHYRNGGHLSRKVLRLLSKDFRTTNRLV